MKYILQYEYYQILVLQNVDLLMNTIIFVDLYKTLSNPF